MRRVVNLSTEAVAVLLFVSRQRLRLNQHIPLSDVRAAINCEDGRLKAAIDECVQGGWLLVEREPRSQDHYYSMIAAGRRRVARLRPKLN